MPKVSLICDFGSCPVDSIHCPSSQTACLPACSPPSSVLSLFAQLLHQLPEVYITLREPSSPHCGWRLLHLLLPRQQGVPSPQMFVALRTCVAWCGHSAEVSFSKSVGAHTRQILPVFLGAKPLSRSSVFRFMVFLCKSVFVLL